MWGRAGPKALMPQAPHWSSSPLPGFDWISSFWLVSHLPSSGAIILPSLDRLEGLLDFRVVMAVLPLSSFISLLMSSSLRPPVLSLLPLHSFLSSGTFMSLYDGVFGDMSASLVPGDVVSGYLLLLGVIQPVREAISGFVVDFGVSGGLSPGPVVVVG